MTRREKTLNELCEGNIGMSIERITLNRNSSINLKEHYYTGPDVLEKKF